MTKKALITGIRGQDGAYLAEFLLEKGYDVYGADRRSGDSMNWRLRELGIENDIKIIYMDLLEKSNIRKTIEKVLPDEVYNLAAQSFVGVSFEQPVLTSEIDAMGVLRLLISIRDIKPDTKFYQASTSEMFGKVQEIPQSEKTPFYPRSPYGVAKLFGHWITINYRESFNMYACSGILFNHESPLRGIEFVTRKVSYGVAKGKYDHKDKIILGNLDVKRDWGYAKEYVEGMWLMLQQNDPDDFILATGETHSVREFVECAYSVVDIDIEWDGEGIDTKGVDKKTGNVLVEISEDFFRPAEVNVLIGNSQKAEQVINWKPKTKFKNLVEIMVKADLKRVEKGII